MTTPLFPLPELVLFPGQVLPLYIFEPRYRDLLARVRDTGEPFGIVRIATQPEMEGNEGRPLQSRIGRVGSLAWLREVSDHEDGTASVVVVGGERFRIQELDQTHTYLSAVIREDPLPQPEHEAPAVSALASQLLEVLVMARHSDEDLIRQNAPQEPLLMASFAAGLLPISSETREAALAAGSLLDRLDILLSSMPRERVLN